LPDRPKKGRIEPRNLRFQQTIERPEKSATDPKRTFVMPRLAYLDNRSSNSIILENPNERIEMIKKVSAPPRK